MKAIANVTMIFLPGTFMASIFAMPFFEAQKEVKLHVNAEIWIYIVVTVPLTIFTLVSAYIWYHFSARSHRPLQDVDSEESRLNDIGEDQSEAVSCNSVPSPCKKSCAGGLPRDLTNDPSRIED